jgi:glucose/mannose transport system permease protein
MRLPGRAARAGARSPDYAASMAGALITTPPAPAVHVVPGRWFIGGPGTGSVTS